MIWFWVGMASGTTLVAEWGFESGSEGFAASGIPELWECGEVLSGPGQGSSGISACGTGLSGNYGNNSESFLEFPDLSLSGLSTPMLRWQNWYALESGDFGLLEIFDGSSWQPSAPVYGYPNGVSYEGQDQEWHTQLLDLSGVTNLNALRLRLSSDTSVTDDGWFIDSVTLWDGDVAPPLISEVTVLEDTEDLDGPYAVSATVVDNQSLQSVDLLYSINGGTASSLSMTNLSGNEFFAEIPGQLHDSRVTYWVVASDSVNQEQFPAEGAFEFRVRLPAPEDLWGPEGIVHAAKASVSWSAPDTGLTVVSYLLYQSDEFLLETSALEAEVNLLGGGQDRFYVTAFFDAGEGDPSEELVLDSAVPKVLSVEPRFVFQGDQIRTELSAENLLFVQDDLELDFGQGIEVTQIDVRDVDTLIVRLEVAVDAIPGPRVVSAESGGLGASLLSAVQVIDGKERPKVIQLDPPVGRQGSLLDLEITTSKSIGEVYQVDLGEGILIQEVVSLEDSLIQVKGWIEENAPLGDRMVTVDDGERIWAGESFRVLDRSPPPVGCTSQSENQTAGVAAFLLLCLFSGSRRRSER